MDLEAPASARCWRCRRAMSPAWSRSCSRWSRRPAAALMLRGLQGQGVPRARGARADHAHGPGAGDVQSLPARAATSGLRPRRLARSAAIGGAPMPEATIARLAEMLPQLQLMNLYGATETTSPATIMPARHTAGRTGQRRRGPVPCGELRVMDDDGREVRPAPRARSGSAGRWWCRATGRSPSSTRRDFCGGYWRSGDIGALDADGYRARLRSHQGHDQPRRLQGLLRRGRERLSLASGRARGGGRGAPRSGARREGPGVRQGR